MGLWIILGHQHFRIRGIMLVLLLLGCGGDHQLGLGVHQNKRYAVEDAWP